MRIQQKRRKFDQILKFMKPFGNLGVHFGFLGENCQKFLTKYENNLGNFKESFKNTLVAWTDRKS